MLFEEMHKEIGVWKELVWKMKRIFPLDLGVSKNGGTPKWMVKIMEHPIKMDDLGENPLFSEASICRYFDFFRHPMVMEVFF